MHVFAHLQTMRVRNDNALPPALQQVDDLPFAGPQIFQHTIAICVFVSMLLRFSHVHMHVRVCV